MRKVKIRGKGTEGYWGRTPEERKRLQVGIERAYLKDLRPWAENPRFNADAVEPLSKLIAEHGFAGVIVATPDGVIRAGHTRFEAVKLLGWETIPVQWKNFPSVEAAEAFALADNKSSEWADWDHAKLARMFKKRVKADRDLLAKFSGFRKQEIDWGGASKVDPDSIDDAEFERNLAETFVIRIDEISVADRDIVFKRVQKALASTKYVARLF